VNLSTSRIATTDGEPGGFHHPGQRGLDEVSVIPRLAMDLETVCAAVLG
jgi:hypothetical protein